jgi:hypothetical protein
LPRFDMLRCDNCSKTSESDKVVSWRELTILGIDVSLPSEVREPVLCSWRCIREYADRMMARDEARRK